MAMKAALPCAAVAAALMYAVAATAQNSVPSKPQQESQTEPAASSAPDPARAKTSPPALTEGAKKAAEKHKGREGSERPGAAAAAHSAETASAEAECAWVGKRVVSLLVRDDVDTATDFTRFYAMFHCPETHIGATLACVVSDPGAAREGAALTEHVDLCWANPSTRLLPQKPPNPDKPAPAAGK